MFGISNRPALPRLAAGLALTVAVLGGGVWLWHMAQETAGETPQGLASSAEAPPPSIEAASPAADVGDGHPLERLARRSPEEAWRAATELEQSPSRKHLLKTIATLWVEKDPQAALAAAVSLGGWENRLEPWIADLAAEWARAEPRTAADWALGLPALPEDGALLAAVHAALSVTSADEAFELAGKFGDEKTRSAYYHPMYERQLRTLLGNDLLALAEWLVRQPDAKLRGSKVRPIARRYGLLLPDDAVQWALQLPDDLSKDGLGAVVQGIAGRDPSRAEGIVLGMAGQGSQAHAALGFLMQWAWERDQPAAAYRWSVENLPSSARLEANQSVLAKWAFTDPVAVASALADIADPDERFAAQKGAMLGLVGADMDATPEQVRARMLAVEEVFDSLRVAAAARGVWDDGRGNEFGGPVRRLLYGYWKEVDPARAAKYKEPPERYDERQ